MSESTSTPSGISRRRLLTGAAALGGAAATSFALPSSVQQALAKGTPSKPFNLKDIKHVVILMQENRSFDHYFGILSGVRGFSDPTAITLGTGRSVFYQPSPMNPLGYQLPFHLDTSKTAAQALTSTSHDWLIQHSAWNFGAMDSFVRSHMESDGAVKAGQIMGYFTRDDIPFHYALAESFTLLDNYHSSVMGPTDPNRMMHMSGTIDPDGTLGGGPILDTSSQAIGSWTTYPERLEAAGVSWKIYNEADTSGSVNIFSHFTQYANAAPGDVLYEKGGMAARPGQFEYDCLKGTLPTISWINPGSDESEHPTDSMPAQGAAFIYSKLDAIASNPELWNSTLFILNYDENDGLFDHVPPPVPPAGTPGEFVDGYSIANQTPGGGMPIGPGFRVPCVIVSPWTAGGYVFSELSDHTSVLRFLELITGIKETNISAWRRKTMSNLTGALQRHSNVSLPAALGSGAAKVDLATYEAANLPSVTAPTTKQSMPRQEPGKRKRVGGGYPFPPPPPHGNDHPTGGH